MFFQIIICLTLPFSLHGITRNPRIIGGIEATVQNFPYSASLKRTSTDEHLCGGSIISNKHILTAAHCFGNGLLEQTDFKVYTGSSFLSRPSNVFEPEKVYIHPSFVGILDFQTYCNDIAIIKVNGFIEFNEYQNKINLPTKDIYTGTIGLLSGWGYKTYPARAHPDQLQSVWMKAYESYHCRTYFPIDYTVNIDQFCGFRGKGVGPCIGDSGSPFVSDGKVIGIVSISIPCATGVPDIYTKVYSHLDFIQNTLGISEIN